MISTSKISLESKVLISNPSFLLRTSPAVTIPKSKRFCTEISKITPGPGSYNMHSASSTAITFPRTYRNTLEKLSNNPGPGFYRIPDLAPGPRFSISRRISTKSPISPGPGQYDTPHTHRPQSVIFTKSRRKINFASGESPGPGHYLSNSRKFSSTGTFPKAKTERVKLIDSNLGPGYYETGIKHKCKFAISRERRKSPFERPVS